ncbi:MAG: hypothetical protein ACI86H_002004 [bacterium]|jgi:hypothetical protein
MKKLLFFLLTILSGFYAFGMFILGQSKEETTTSLFDLLEDLLKGLRQICVSEEFDE